MAKLYNLLGIVVAVVGIVAGYLAATSIDVSPVTAGNDFFTAMLRSEAVTDTLQNVQMTVGFSIAGIGICFGIIIFGIGGIVHRIDRQNRAVSS